MQAGSQAVDGASAYLNYDPSVLKVNKITRGTTLTMILEETYDNSLGQVNYTAGTVSNFPSGSFTLMTINFTALRATSGSELVFVSNGLRTTDITYSGSSVMEGTVGGSVSVQDTADMTGRVNLQGRSTAPNSRWVETLSVKLIDHATGVMKNSYTLTTDQSGQFSLTGLEPGTYDIVVKNSHALANRKDNVTLAIGSNTVDMGTLKEGDANNDNKVSLLDFSVLASTFSKCQGTSGYDSRADFNQDNCITLLDFSLLATNFSQAGASTSNQANVAGIETTRGRGANSGKVKIVMEGPKKNPKVKSVFQVPVMVDAGVQGVDGVQVSLKFDPRYLKVKRIVAGTGMPVGLLSTYDNKLGTIQYSAGKLDGLEAGKFMLMTVEFEAVAPVNKTSLTFGYGMLDGTMVSKSGTDVLGMVTGLVLKIVK